MILTINSGAPLLFKSDAPHITFTNVPANAPVLSRIRSLFWRIFRCLLSAWNYLIGKSPPPILQPPPFVVSPSIIEIGNKKCSPPKKIENTTNSAPVPLPQQTWKQHLLPFGATLLYSLFYRSLQPVVTFGINLATQKCASKIESLLNKILPEQLANVAGLGIGGATFAYIGDKIGYPQGIHFYCLLVLSSKAFQRTTAYLLGANLPYTSPGENRGGHARQLDLLRRRKFSTAIL